MQDRFKKSMTNYLIEYKQKLRIHYIPNVYELTTKNLTYSTVYILAVNEKQATSFAFSQGFFPTGIRICDSNDLMTRFNKKDEEFNLTIRELKENAKEIPSLLGGY